MDSKGGVGILVIGLGVTQIVGSITGQEAPMLAALFQPSLLRTKSGGQAVPKPPSVGQIAGLNPAGVAGGFAGWAAGVGGWVRSHL